MLDDKFKVIKFLKEYDGQFCVDNIVESLLENFKNELLSEKDQNLLKIAFSKNPTQQELDIFLQNWDIEAVDSKKALMLSYFMKLHPNLTFPEYFGPRLKGLLTFLRFQNMKLISQYKKICKKFIEKGINEIIVFKGGAMRHLRPDLSRMMGDIDIIVREKDYVKAGKISESLGYDCAWDIHSVDLHPKGSDEGVMDIHKYIYMGTGSETAIVDDLFNRSKKEDVFGIPALIPSNEDMLFITLVNMARNLTNKTSWGGVLFALFDVKFLIESKPDFDWNIVLKNAKKTKTQEQLCFATKFINNIIPDLLDEKLLVDVYFEKKLKNYCILLMYQRFFLWHMKQRSHELKFGEIFKDFSKFVEYLKLKPKYFILKLFFIRKNPKFANLILKLDEKYNIAGEIR